MPLPAIAVEEINGSDNHTARQIVAVYAGDFVGSHQGEFLCGIVALLRCVDVNMPADGRGAKAVFRSSDTPNDRLSVRLGDAQCQHLARLIES